MRKLIVIVILAIFVAFAASAEKLRYNVKYQNEFHNAQTTWYNIDTEVKELKGITKAAIALTFKYNEIIDEDADAKDLAIVNKLDRQGYEWAETREFGELANYIKKDGVWHKLTGLLKFYNDEPVILGD